MALHLDGKTRSLVEEFSTTGFVGVKNHALHAPKTPNAVHSITSDSLTTLASREGWSENIVLFGSKESSRLGGLVAGVGKMQLCLFKQLVDGGLW